MDLVVGSTGLVGQQVALGLGRLGRRVRALVRCGTHHEKAAPLLSAGVEIVDADLTKPESLPSACAGVETLLTTATSMPQGKDDGLRRVDHDGTLALIESAERAGVRHFVYTSYSGNIRVDSPLETAKRDCEKRLLSSKMRVTVLRPSYFMEIDRKSTRLNSSHGYISYAVFCLKKKKKKAVHVRGDSTVGFLHDH